MAKDRSVARVDPLDFEHECATWDWARAAGVSAQELHEVLRESLRSAEAAGYRAAA